LNEPPGTFQDDEEGWLSWLSFDGDSYWLLLGFLVVVLGVGCSFLTPWSVTCTSQEGLCTTATCTCSDPAQQLRELRTPEGQHCWQCMAFCPADSGEEETNPVVTGETSQCYRGMCECEDPTQERVQMEGSTPDSPCYRCVTPPPVVSLRSDLNDNSACLVRASRSKAPPPPRAANLGIGTDGTMVAEPALRLVLVSVDAAEQNETCASFVREGLTLRDRNTSLCLSWSSSGSVWGLGKCAGAGTPEAPLQSFSEVAPEHQTDGNATSFCVQPSAAWGDTVKCVGLRGHVCSTELGVCTPQACECEDATWLKQEVMPAEGDVPQCWSCSPPVTPFCSTALGVCTTTPCECEDPSHEKVEANTSEPALRTCWSCRPNGGYGGGAGAKGGVAAGALVLVFLCSLLGGRFVRRWGEGPVPAGRPSQKGKRKAAAAFRPLRWSERLALELEDMWGVLEDGAGFVGQLFVSAAKPFRRWRRNVSGVMASYFKGAKDRVHMAGAHVCSTASSLGAVASTAKGKACAHSPSKGTASNGTIVSPNNDAPTPSHSDSPAIAVAGGRSGGAARTKKASPRNVVAAAAEEPQKEATTEGDTEAHVPQISPSPRRNVSEPAADKVKVDEGIAATSPPPTTTGATAATSPSNGADSKTSGEEAVARRRRRPKKARPVEVSTVSLAETPAVDVINGTLEAEALEAEVLEAEAVEARPLEAEALEAEAPEAVEEATDVVDEAMDSNASGAAWDPLAVQEASRMDDIQHARLLMLMPRQDQNTAQKVDKDILAAKWLLVYHIRASKASTPDNVDNVTEARPEDDREPSSQAADIATNGAGVTASEESGPSRRRRKKRGRRSNGDAEAEAEEEDACAEGDAEADGASTAWDPLGTGGATIAEDDGRRQGGLQHARLLLLTTDFVNRGAPLSKRAMAATWLVCYHMPDTFRQLRSRRGLPPIEAAATVPPAVVEAGGQGGRRRKRHSAPTASKAQAEKVPKQPQQPIKQRPQKHQRQQRQQLQKTQEQEKEKGQQRQTVDGPIESPEEALPEDLIVDDGHVDGAEQVEAPEARQENEEAAEADGTTDVGENAEEEEEEEEQQTQGNMFQIRCKQEDFDMTPLSSDSFKVCRTFIELNDGSDEHDAERPLALRLKKSVSCGDFPIRGDS